MSERRVYDANERGPCPGERVAGRYRIERVIGRGGMGHVVAARDDAGRPVAIKLLRPAPAFLCGKRTRRDADAVWRERFAREGEILARTRSPHLVAVHAHTSIDAPAPYIVMDRLVGSDLAKIAGMAVAQAIEAIADIVVQACAALATLHGAGIVHRDVKPANIFEHVEADGTRTLKLLDLGIAKVVGVDDAASHQRRALDVSERARDVTTSRDGMLGTPAFMSPEHIRDPRRVDHRSDLWALGVVAYQLATGTLPFDGRSIGEIFFAAISADFVRLEASPYGVPGPMARAIDACLSVDPALRPRTAAELARELSPFASSRVAAVADAIPHTTTTRPAPAPPSHTNVIALAHGARVDGRDATLTMPHTPGATQERSVRASGIFSSDSSDSLALVR